MSLFNELTAISEGKKLKKIYNSLNEKYLELKSEYLATLTEGMIDDHNGPFEREFDELEKRFAAAKRGIQLANTLKDPMDRKRHKSRIFGNLNRIRSALHNIMLKLNMGDAD